MACSLMLCLSSLFLSFISKAYGSDGCPKSKSLIIRGSYQIVTWDTTWTDYQSKVCKWRLNFQTPEVVNFSLRLEKLAICSHGVFVYSGMGIVRKRLDDKVEVRVCGDGNQTELHTSAIGKELQFMGAALCFVIPHGDYNFGQDIFTTHFINMTISLRKQHYVDRTALTTGSSRKVSNRSPPITPTSTSHKTRPSVIKVASLAVSTPRLSSSSHAGSDVTHPNIETAFVTRSTVPGHSVEIPTSESTSEKNTEEYLIAGIVSGVVLILMMTIIFVVYKFKVTVSDGESSLYSTDYSQPLPWRKNWVITKSFSEIEAERAKPDIQLKPSLPYRPSLKQHPVVSRQGTASTRLDEDNDGVYDNIVAVATHEIFPAMEAANFKRPDRYSDGSEFWDFENLSNNLKMQQLHTNKE
uniref:CUB domain-containing protein n=1 Tax=Magallana gigas TaxID=29159 RepID=A0A8W8NNP7_MAGGI